jgi:hypothetical protein
MGISVAVTAMVGEGGATDRVTVAYGDTFNGETGCGAEVAGAQPKARIKARGTAKRRGWQKISILSLYQLDAQVLARQGGLC